MMTFKENKLFNRYKTVWGKMNRLSNIFISVLNYYFKPIKDNAIQEKYYLK